MRLASISRTAADAFTARHYHVRLWEDRVESDGVAGERLPELLNMADPSVLPTSLLPTNLTL
jgi:hypothetical protein